MDSVASYLSSNEIDMHGKLTVLPVPVMEIIPEDNLFVNPDNGQKITHTDKWMNYDSQEADDVVSWYNEVIKNKPGTFTIKGCVTDNNGDPENGVLVEAGLEGVDYKNVYTHFDLTDKNGFYKIDGLTKGKRIVMVKKNLLSDSILTSEIVEIKENITVNFKFDK
jgi:hypothetical protein